MTLRMTMQSAFICCFFTFRLQYCVKIAFSALTMLDGRKGIRPVKNGGWWRWALVSPDGVAPSWTVSMSAAVNLPLHHKVQKFSSGTGSSGWSRKKGRKTVVVVWWYQRRSEGGAGGAGRTRRHLLGAANWRKL